MKRLMIVTCLALTALGAGCNSTDRTAALQQKGPPPAAPDHVPLPTPVKPLGQLPAEATINRSSDEDRVKALETYFQGNSGAAVAADAVSVPAGSVSASGSFHDVHHKVSGSAKIIGTGNKAKLVLSNDFSTEWGPDLRVVVSGNADPKTAGDVHEGAYADLGPIQGTSGAQVFDLSGVNVADIKSISIYCKPFMVVFGSAPVK